MARDPCPLLMLRLDDGRQKSRGRRREDVIVQMHHKDAEQAKPGDDIKGLDKENMPCSVDVKVYISATESRCWRRGDDAARVRFRLPVAP